MQVRNIYTVKNNQITIDLPDSFKYTAVEIIILPIEKSSKQLKEKVISKEEQLKQLLSVSRWNEKDLEAVIYSQKMINQWKIEEF